MTWIYRTRSKPKIKRGRISPEYASGSGHYSIRMYHSGVLLKNLGRTTYFGGDISHFDFCHSDKMSMLELVYMATEAGLTGQLDFYFSKNGVTDTGTLTKMTSDMDAFYLGNFVDENKMVGVYVDHQTQSQVESISENTQVHNDIEIVAGDAIFSELDDVVIENSGLGVDENNVAEVNENNVAEAGGQNTTHESNPSNVNESNGQTEVGGENTTHESNPSNVNETNEQPIPATDDECRFDYDIMDSTVGEDSDDAVSIGSDSSLSDALLDSDDEVSDDDLLFEESIDPNVEWGGAKSSTVNVSTVNIGSSKSKPRSDGPIIFKKSDLENPKFDFQLSMQFEDMKLFRQAIRQYAIYNGRDVRFPINDRNKVQARCKHKKCPWLIYGSLMSSEDAVQVKTYDGKHKCP